MSEQPYKQPPITEAVIELRFATPVEASDIAKVSADFKSIYPLQQPAIDFRVHVNLGSCYLGPGRRETGSSRSAGASGHSIGSVAATMVPFPCRRLPHTISPLERWREQDSNPRFPEQGCLKPNRRKRIARIAQTGCRTAQAGEIRA